ncbi:MAG: aminotransferase class III-fold pyridoxal phosphate-dependent enzyme [Pseudomonadota bacterium]|nr:aminotransferase class III-fold pyridoxal phosphate-dependent enzyme [Pseudomonadota bacterium]
MYSLNDLLKGKGNFYYKKAKKIIPGGTQLLSKRPEMFAPNIWPSYYSKAKGCKVWDLDGREFIDMSIMSVGACILGYADDEVDNAVVKALKDGVSSSLNCYEEFQLARELIELHPWFGMVRFARSGGEAVNIAVRISRAYTKRDIVMFSGYHGWNDWYISSNLSDNKNLDGQLMPGLKPNGIPRGLKGTSIPFEANDITSLNDKIKGKEKKIAAIVIEPARGEEAKPKYLEKLKDRAKEIGAILIFDEITSGFRMCAGGIHKKYRVYPDLAVFAKSMGNGYAISAITGSEKVMESAQSTFISSTNWTDRIGPAAALATIKKYKKNKVNQKIIASGKKVKTIWIENAKSNGLNIKVSGLPSLASFSFDYKKQTEMNTIFTIEMLKEGFLGYRQFKPSLAHTDSEISKYNKAVKKVFKIISQDLECKNLISPKHHLGFKRLTKE